MIMLTLDLNCSSPSSSIMARAMVFGYVPTREFLLERVRDKNLMQYDVEDEYTVVAALQAGLKDLIAEARLKLPPSKSSNIKNALNTLLSCAIIGTKDGPQTNRLIAWGLWFARD
ncbi:hypothetical protein QCA50_006443 [Cerrena zonata]|uniref:Uncharacterized protein n=1 Tax=Cerrena zonata TaxID=2478898 RepID=A0AAW0GDM7_9APHY